MTFIIFLVLFFSWLNIIHSLSVTVTCSAKQIDLLFIFDDPFYGMISMKPKYSCFVKGDGHPKLLLTLALGNGTGQKCSVIQRDGFNLAVIDVKIHSELQTNDDISYLIRCPVMNPNEKTKMDKKLEMPPGAMLEIVEKNSTLKKIPAIVGKPYDLKLVIPSNLKFDIKIGQCIAFTTENEFEFLPLTDQNGCPLTKEFSHEFHMKPDNYQMKSNFKTKIEMFNLGDSEHLYLQCELKICHQKCSQANCKNSKQNPNANLHDDNFQTFLAATQVEIEKPIKKVVVYCNTFLDSPTTAWILTAILAILTTAVWYVTIMKHKKFLFSVLLLPKIERKNFKNKVKSLFSRIALFFGKTEKEDNQKSAFLGEHFPTVLPPPKLQNISKSIPNYQDSINFTEIISIPPPPLPEKNEKDVLYQLDLVPDPPKYSVVKKSLSLDTNQAEFGLPINYSVDKKLVSCNSTLDRPIKQRNIHEKCSSPINQQEKFHKVTCVDPELLAGLNSSNLLVDLQKLSESLKILRDSTLIQSQSSSIERPRSAGSAYHMLPTMQNH